MPNRLAAAAQLHKSSIEPHIASPGKKWKFKVRFLLNVYCFGTVVKSKKRKLTPPKSGIVCTIKVGWDVMI